MVFLSFCCSRLILLFQFDQASKHTDTRKFSRDTVAVLKGATEQDSEINKKLEELLKK